jgi:hypothetical protein
MPYTYIDDGTGGTLDDPESKTWYHGSHLLLEILAIGSSITRNKELAIAFSHKPSRVEASGDGKVLTIHHNGKQNGYLYEIAEPVSMEDIYVHPHINIVNPDDKWEWLTKKPFRLKLIQETIA